MADPETIANQELLLAQHRRRLVMLLEQQARFGDHTPAHIRLDIEDAQRSIHEIKVQLRDWGVAVEDRPEDTAVPARAVASDPLTQVQALLDQLPLDTIPDVAPLPPSSRMPLVRNPLFVGREEDLKQLAATLKGRATAAIGQIAAVVGLGGIGKTNLASEFVHRYGQFFVGGVFFLSFANPAAILGEIASCGAGLNLPGFENLKLDEQVTRVKQEWQQPTLRLLIFDNCEDEALLKEWQPTSGGCRVLVTSRRAEWDLSLGVTVLPLDVLLRAESIALLRAFRPDLTEDDADLNAIAGELGDLPLALHMAGSFLKQFRVEISPADYLAELRGAAVLGHESLQGVDLKVSPTNHDLHIGRTFTLSYERLQSDDLVDALALALLARAAHLAPGEPIPRELLLSTVELPDKVARRRAIKALNRLAEVGLLEAEEGGALTLHRLLARFVDSVVADDEAQPAVVQALGTATAELNEKGYSLEAAPILPHLRHVTMAMLREDAGAAWLCNELGYLLQAQGELAAARPYYERALAIYQQVLGSQHPDTASSLNNLGTVLQAQGENEAARGYLERALAIREEILGARHTDTATSLSNLGMLLQAQGENETARGYLERALAIREEMLGASHPNTALSLNNLAVLLRAQGEYGSARRYYERASAIYQEVLGERHPDTARSLNNLAVLHADAGRFEEAIPLMQRALAIREAVLGSQHPDTQASRQSLAAMTEITQQAKEVIASVFADSGANVRAALAEQLEARAQQIEAEEEVGSLYLALVAHLRALAARLHEQSRSPVPGDTDAEDGSAG